MCWRNQAESLRINLHTNSEKKKMSRNAPPSPENWSLWSSTAVSLSSPLMVRGRLFCVGVCLSVCRLPDIHVDQSDCGPDGPWCGWLDQVERYQTTHSGWHKLWGLSVLGGRGSKGTMETLQSNKLIRRETDTPVHYRVTETEGTEREVDKGR